MSVVCTECQFSNPEGSERCKRCKFSFDGDWPSLINQTINNYKLVRRVGGGGFGAVYEARHVALGNAFAVKILHPRLAQDSAFTARFQSEAHVLAELRHENVLQVIDFGFVDEVGFYLITEWLEGHSLFRVMRAHPKPEWGWVWELFSQLLDALHYAHERGIVHRDLKPENLVLTTGSRNRMILKIVDFGIAQLVGGDPLEHGEADTGRKRSKYAVGTPYYMAPEQVRGDVLRIGAHTDLYACGVILSEILTGHRPFEGGGQRETMRLQLEAFAPRLAELDPTGSYPEVFELLVQKALKKDVEERFEVAPQFAQALDEAMQSVGKQPIVEDIYQSLEPRGEQRSNRKKRPTIVYRKRKKPSGGRRFALAFAALALVSVALVGWIWMSIYLKKPEVVKRQPPKKRKIRVLSGGWNQFAAPPDSRASGASLRDSGVALEAVESADAGQPESEGRPSGSLKSQARKVPRGRRSRRLRRRRSRTRARTRARTSARPLIVLRVLSKPSGALVFLNGESKGTTPALLRVRRGNSVKVMLKKKGYVSKTITVRATKPMTRKINLIEDLF